MFIQATAIVISKTLMGLSMWVYNVHYAYPISTILDCHIPSGKKYNKLDQPCIKPLE